MELTTAAIAKIDNANNIQQALTITGDLGDSYFVRLAYIKAKRGARAVGGFFNPTIANVANKFAHIWNEDNTK